MDQGSGFIGNFDPSNLTSNLFPQTWSEAYKVGINKTVQVLAWPSTAEQSQLNYQHPMQDPHIVHFQSTPITHSLFGAKWPDANEHPLYYVGIYAAIGLSIVLSSSLSGMTQYTGALKASRTLFK